MRYESNKPIKSKLPYRQSINQPKVSNESLRLIDWFNPPSEKLPHGDDFRVGPKSDRTPRDNTVICWHSLHTVQSPLKKFSTASHWSTSNITLLTHTITLSSLSRKKSTKQIPFQRVCRSRWQAAVTTIPNRCRHNFFPRSKVLVWKLAYHPARNTRPTNLLLTFPIRKNLIFNSIWPLRCPALSRNKVIPWWVWWVLMRIWWDLMRFDGTWWGFDAFWWRFDAFWWDLMGFDEDLMRFIQGPWTVWSLQPYLHWRTLMAMVIVAMCARAASLHYVPTNKGPVKTGERRRKKHPIVCGNSRAVFGGQTRHARDMPLKEEGGQLYFQLPV